MGTGKIGGQLMGIPDMTPSRPDLTPCPPLTLPLKTVTLETLGDPSFGFELGKSRSSPVNLMGPPVNFTRTRGGSFLTLTFTLTCLEKFHQKVGPDPPHTT